MLNFDRNTQTITIEGEIYSATDFTDADEPLFTHTSDFHHDLYIFLREWFNESPTLQVKTSGSTGTPKLIEIEKKKMMQSASLTCQFLKLKKDDTALLCMPLDYIAGKMMVVRSLIASLDLYPVTPSGNPLKETDIIFDFAAMVPLQAYNSLQSGIESDRLKQIRKLIIGGGAIDTQIEDAVKDFPYEVYSTYGMTETLSHIALRKLNDKHNTSHYIPFDSVKLSLSGEDTLIIDAPLVSNDTLYTNDVARIYENGSFDILGRKDNIINSGGIKIQIEEVESILKPWLNGNFAITSLPDAKFGEIIVLLTEQEIDTSEIKKHLPEYYFPKKIIRVPAIPLSETGKPKRAEIKRLALLMSEKKNL